MQQHSQIPLFEAETEKQQAFARIAQLAEQIVRQRGVFRDDRHEKIKQVIFRQNQRFRLVKMPVEVERDRMLRRSAGISDGLLSERLPRR